MKHSIHALATALLLLCLSVPAAQANVVIGGTRVVFPAQDGEVTVRLTNNNKTPALVEAWIDSGDEHSTPDKVNTPFLITPPIFRMDPHKDQSLRILYTQNKQPLPTDRESLFWLNVLEIPPKPSGKAFAGKNLLQFAIRSRLKLFYRPAHLAGDPAKAPSLVTWTSVPDGQGYALEVHNPTPYHVTIVQATITVGGKSYVSDSGMVDPFGKLDLKVKNLATAPASGTPVTYDIVNDYGATTPLKGSVAP
ncbi:fimbrial biogenesis chaperone [Rhodanobacter glycinis]|uniref:Chaperone protein EcpD n=1 Tax=Rhodanobacter glycinis TaxID=582702 RepID=A0A1I3Z0P7_9GAMM|nr:fimbria/pilus periplasmic chaperone [Rhodanobacter glycinis]SFK37682.1 chaperone protein EcpD [Rhodanobacter glycinis]